MKVAPARTPEFITSLDVDDAKIQKRAQRVQIFWRGCDDLRLIVRRTAAPVDGHPDVCEPQKRRLAFSQNRGSKNITIKRHRTSYVCDYQRYSHDKFRVRIVHLH